jgi:hypothetical protein
MQVLGRRSHRTLGQYAAAMAVTEAALARRAALA